MNHCCWWDEVMKLFFKYLQEDWISSGIVKKYFLKALVIEIGSVKVALLSNIALGNVWFEPFSEMFISLKVVL